jgi:hypothetical protein
MVRLSTHLGWALSATPSTSPATTPYSSSRANLIDGTPRVAREAYHWEREGGSAEGWGE